MEDGHKSLQKLDKQDIELGDTLHIERELEGQTIYVFDVQAGKD